MEVEERAAMTEVGKRAATMEVGLVHCCWR
jgi:hypothetical protein